MSGFPVPRETRRASEARSAVRRTAGRASTAARRVRSSGAGEQATRKHQVRTVEHLAVEGQHARTRIALERGDDALGPVNLLRGGREDLVDDRDLVGMDGDLAA